MDKYTIFWSKIAQEIFHEIPGIGLSLQGTDSSSTERIIPEISKESACFILMFLEIQALFQPVSDWYQKIKESLLMNRYLHLVNFFISLKPALQSCLVPCKHCQIPFITYPCNAGRKNLACPFGCGEFLRSEDSKKRSLEYYRSNEGKKKKKLLNQKRCLGLSEKTQEKSEIFHSGCSPIEHNFPENLGTKENPIHTHLIKLPECSNLKMFYLQSMVSLFEGRRFSREEIKGFVKILRQHSLDQDASKRYSHEKDPNSS